jgi:RimJ/RimL family protein N-acetyltransferase
VLIHPDGPEPILVRPIRPDDKALLARGIERLSPETSYRRFLSPKGHLSRAELRYLTEIDFVNHYALVAVPPSEADCALAVGRWVRLADDPRAAEVAVVVADHLQGRGIGTALGTALADAARERGIERFTATILADNEPAHRLFARISERLSIEHQGSIDELSVDLAA